MLAHSSTLVLLLIVCSMTLFSSFPLQLSGSPEARYFQSPVSSWINQFLAHSRQSQLSSHLNNDITMYGKQNCCTYSRFAVYQALKTEESPCDFQASDLCSVPRTTASDKYVVSLPAQSTAASAGCFCFSDCQLGVDNVPSLVQCLRTYCSVPEGHYICIRHTMQH